MLLLGVFQMCLWKCSRKYLQFFFMEMHPKCNAEITPENSPETCTKFFWKFFNSFSRTYTRNSVWNSLEICKEILGIFFESFSENCSTREIAPEVSLSVPTDSSKDYLRIVLTVPPKISCDKIFPFFPKVSSEFSRTG